MEAKKLILSTLHTMKTLRFIANNCDVMQITKLERVRPIEHHFIHVELITNPNTYDIWTLGRMYEHHIPMRFKKELADILIEPTMEKYTVTIDGQIKHSVTLFNAEP